MVQGLLHDPLDAQPVDVPHGEVLDPQGLQDVAKRGEHNSSTWRPAAPGNTGVLLHCTLALDCVLPCSGETFGMGPLFVTSLCGIYKYERERDRERETLVLRASSHRRCRIKEDKWEISTQLSKEAICASDHAGLLLRVLGL